MERYLIIGNSGPEEGSKEKVCKSGWCKKLFFPNKLEPYFEVFVFSVYVDLRYQQTRIWREHVVSYVVLESIVERRTKFIKFVEVMANQITREELRDLVRNGNLRVVLLIVNSKNTTSDCATNGIKPRLEELGWMKVGAEGDYGGMRGCYARSIRFEGEYQTYIGTVRGFLDQARTSLTERVQEFAKDDDVAEVHCAVVECLLYDEAVVELLELPRN